MSWNKIEWTKEQDDYIKKSFAKVKEIDMIETLGVSLTALKNHIDEIIPHDFRNWKNWTDIEDEILLKSYGKISMDELSYKLRRSKNSISLRLHKIEGVTDMASVSGFLIPTDIASIMGVDHKTVIYWVDRKKIKCYRPNRKILFNEYYFWNWLKENMDRVNYKRVDEYILMTSPEWYSKEVKEKQKEIYKNDLLNKYKTPYSPIENATLLDLRKKGYTYNEIAKEIGRTMDSVKMQLRKLRKIKESKVS